MGPEALAMTSMGGTVAGTLLSALGAGQQAGAQAAVFNYQAGIAKMNQRIASQNADYERAVGEVSAQISGMKTRAQVGATTAAQASSGLDVNRGSAVDVRTSETEIGQYNEAVIRANAARKAYGYEVEATQDEAQSKLYQMSAASSKTAGQLGILKSLLSGGTAVADKYLKGRSVGLFPGSEGVSGDGGSDSLMEA